MFAKRLLILALLVSSLLSALFAICQEDSKTIKTRVNLVEVVLFAMDAEGRHVTDLQAEDLNLFVTGKLTKISFFDKFDTGVKRFIKNERLGATYTGTGQANYTGEPRYFTFIFHRLQYNPAALKRAKKATCSLLETHILANDHVAVIFFDKETDSELPFSTEHHKAIEFIEQAEIKFRKVKWEDDFLEFLGEKATEYAKIPHRVNIILLTEGMFTPENQELDLYQETIEKLQAANIRVFGVDAGGVSLTDPGTDVIRFGAAANKIGQSFNLGLYSQPTGGTFHRNHNDMLDMLTQIDYETSFGYSVGFYVEDEQLEQTLDLKIESTRPALKLTYKNSFKAIFMEGN